MVTALVAGFLLGAGARGALANPFLPAPGRVFQGVAGVNPVGPFRLYRFPRSARALGNDLSGRKFPSFASEFARAH